MEESQHTMGRELNLLPVDAAFVLISNITAFLSLAGCIVIIFCYIKFRAIRTRSRLLLVFLSFADMILALSSLVQTGTYYRSIHFPPEGSFLCQSAAALMVFANICCALWTAAITVYLFLCVCGKCIREANSIFFLFHGFCWIMPFVVTSAGDVFQVYGYNAVDVVRDGHPTACWLSDRVVNPLPWYLLTVEGWVMAAFLLVALLYIPISLAVYCRKSEEVEDEEEAVIEQLAVQTANEQLRFIPAIFVCCRIWGTAHFLLTRMPENSRLRSYDFLLVMRAFGDNAQGLVNAIFFCLATKQIRNILTNRLLGCCSKARRSRVIGTARWSRVPAIVRSAISSNHSRRRNLDPNDLDITGISLDTIPPADLEDDVIFER